MIILRQKLHVLLWCHNSFKIKIKIPVDSRHFRAYVYFMKKSRQGPGKISDHFKGLGTVTRDTVTERAREIALINGRPPNHYNQDDFNEAKRELTGVVPEADGEAEEETIAGLVTWDEPPGATGHPVKKELPEDEQNWATQLAEEGMEEAEHEQMVEGARNPHNQE
jgi:hypothetical protein